MCISVKNFIKRSIASQTMSKHQKKDILRQSGFFVLSILMLMGLSSCSELSVSDQDKLSQKVTPFLNVVDTDQAINKIIFDVNMIYLNNLNTNSNATEKDKKEALNVFQLDKATVMSLQSYAAIDNYGRFSDTIDTFALRMYVYHQDTISGAQIDAFTKALTQYFWDTRSIWASLFREDSNQASSLSTIDTRTFNPQTTTTTQTQQQGPQPP